MVTRPDAPAGRGRHARAVAGRRLGRRARHRGAHPGPARGSPISGPAGASSRPTACRSSPTARWCRRPRWRSRGHGWINLHFSLLPAWRGAAPVQHAVLHGDEVTGASVFQLEAGLDTGPGLRHPGREDRAARHLRRPAGPARRRRRRPARVGARRDRGRHGAGRAAAGRRRLPRAEDHRRGRRGALGRSGVRGGPARSGPAPRRPARGRHSAASGSSSAR